MESYTTRHRNWKAQNLGTGKDGKAGGGVAMPAPAITKHMVVNAGKPEVRGKKRGSN